MAYSWGYEDYDWTVEGGQDIPEELERLVNNAVKELFENVPADNDVDRALKVHQAIRVISDTYKTKLGSHARPNWEEPAFRCAYVYLYCLKHSSLVCDILHTLVHQSSVENWENYMKVCCVGGGPGSEIIGLMMYLLNMEVSPYVECTVMDLSTSWEQAWSIIQKHLPSAPKVKVNYTPFDMADSSSWLWREVEAAVSSADLVTFVKSLSAVQTFIANHPIGTGAIPAVLRALKPGAMVLYIDNMRDDSNMMFLHMTRDEGIHLINEWHDITKSKPSKKFIESMKLLEDMFEYRPLRGCKVSAFLFLKPAHNPRIEHEVRAPVLPPPNINRSAQAYGYEKPYHNMPVPHPSRPMLHWTPFGGEVRELRPDPMYRPTFNNIAEHLPQGGVRMMPMHTRRRRRRSSPLQQRKSEKRVSPNKEVRKGPKGRNPSGGDGANSPDLVLINNSTNHANTDKEFDFAADNV